ncbi:YbjN domain-containing protein [Egicoccus sp. AB-alg2]|uniref:T3SS (YopN, CesT) and YbjN peptide-binding chaperone 1 n=1 Tax=Egicoccus sp. AB-alg2 TaxID=3242693 RepID=UPI00359DD725
MSDLPPVPDDGPVPDDEQRADPTRGTEGDAGEARTDAGDARADGGGPGGPGEPGGDPEVHGPGGGREDIRDDADSSEREVPLSAALAAVVPGMRPPRPPRRTGVFVDPDDLRDHVGGLLRAILGGYEVDAFGNFTFLHEGARVFVTVGMSPIGPQVGVFSVTNLDVDLTPPLASFLLTTNHTLGFGSFSYDRENSSVWLRHTLLGTTLDGPELQSAVAAVATTAAQVDDAIKSRFGGRTFAEAPDEVQRRVEPPEPRADAAAPPNASGYL